MSSLIWVCAVCEFSFSFCAIRAIKMNLELVCQIFLYEHGNIR